MDTRNPANHTGQASQCFPSGQLLNRGAVQVQHPISPAAPVGERRMRLGSRPESPGWGLSSASPH